ncbi:MAG: hypothetical protein J2P51_16555, partial [Hyphomicrobiaceae bacterium]|nr:hypothetical protein [Hyphomicrobiaceae bacterium]
MTVERDIDYQALAQDAMRGIVRTVLTRVSKAGLPGEHHFYIAFKTDAPGVVLSKRLREKYPEEMTVVLQHRFWDLAVADDHFEVKLTFDSIPERLVVPFAAIKVFFDPSVPYGLQFEEMEAESEGAQQLAAPRGEAPRAEARGGEASNAGATPEGARAEKKSRATRRASEKGAERPSPAGKVPAKLAAPKTS